MSSQKIRIKLKAYDHKALDQSAAKIVETAKKSQGPANEASGISLIENGYGHLYGRN